VALSNEAVIWDTIITNPSADHLMNLGPSAMKKLKRSAKGKPIDPSRYGDCNGLGYINWIQRKCADIIVHRGKIELKNQKPKYSISAPGGKLALTNDVVLKVHYNVQPWVGVLTWTPQVEFLGWKKMRGGVSKVFSLPALKAKKQTTKT
jgi:signal peptidase complex subunit 3